MSDLCYLLGFLLSAFLCLSFPGFSPGCCRLLSSAYAFFSGSLPRGSRIFFVLLLLLCLLSGFFPVLIVFLSIPLYAAFGEIPRVQDIKAELDSGNVEESAYNREVIASCAALAEPFSRHAVLPLCLMALGILLRIGAAPAVLYWAAQVLLADSPRFRPWAERLGSFSDALLSFLMSISCGLVGHNPLRVQGKNLRERLLSILSLTDIKEAGGHIPVSGDIVQGLLLCCFSSGVLALLLAFVLLLAG